MKSVLYRTWWSIPVSIYDRKAERVARFNKKKQSKNKARTKGYRKDQLTEKDDEYDLKNWKTELSRDTD